MRLITSPFTDNKSIQMLRFVRKLCPYCLLTLYTLKLMQVAMNRMQDYFATNRNIVKLKILGPKLNSNFKKNIHTFL